MNQHEQAPESEGFGQTGIARERTVSPLFGAFWNWRGVPVRAAAMASGILLNQQNFIAEGFCPHVSSPCLSTCCTFGIVQHETSIDTHVNPDFFGLTIGPLYMMKA